MQALEREVRRLDDPRYSTVRSRKSLRHEERGSGKVLWLSVIAITLAYLGFLGFSVIRPKLTAPRPAAPADEAAIPLLPAVDSDPALDIDTPATETVSASVLIDNARRSRNLAEEGRRALRARQWAQAEVKLAEAAEYAPYSYTILFDWATALIEQKRWSAARDVLVRALEVSPESTPARVALAQVFHQLREFQNALAMARWTLEAEPYSETAHQIAAEVYTSLNEFERAITHWQRLVSLNSNDHAAENNLGAAYLKLGQVNQAIKTFENVLRDEPGNSQAYYYMALGFLAKQEPDLAVDVLTRASLRFGRPFVLSWTKGPEFEALRDAPVYRQHFGEATPP